MESPSENSTGITNVLLVDAVPVVRYGLRRLLETTRGFVVGGEAGSADDALAAARRLGGEAPLLIVVGLGLRGEHDSFHLIASLRRELPSALVLVTGANADSMEISRCLFVGADGFLDKACEPESLIRALISAQAGDFVLKGVREIDPGEIARGLEQHRATGGLLSEREREVLLLASDGLTASAIAARLDLSVRTVTTHFGRIYSKLGVKSRMKAIKAAKRCGVLARASHQDG
jgi:DNA-binding NarL/FixJ family response regulator